MQYDCQNLFEICILCECILYKVYQYTSNVYTTLPIFVLFVFEVLIYYTSVVIWIIENDDNVNNNDFL